MKFLIVPSSHRQALENLKPVAANKGAIIAALNSLIVKLLVIKCRLFGVGAF